MQKFPFTLHSYWLAQTLQSLFDFEPFNSVITTHYFSVFFDLYSLQLKNSVFFHAAMILDYNYFLCVNVCGWLCMCVYVCACVRVCICLVALCARVSHVQYQLPEYLARGAVCCLNKGSQSPALKRTFIKHFHSLHLFLLAKTDKLGRLRCHITLRTLSSVPEGPAHAHCSWCFLH